MRNISLIILLSFWISVDAATLTSVRSGNWNDPATWNTNNIPTSEDDVNISHDIGISSNTQVREIHIHSNSTLTLENGRTLECSGDIFISGVMVMSAGTTLNMSDSSPQRIEITPGSSGDGHLQINGTAADSSYLISSGGSFVSISDGNKRGGGRIVATYAHFSNLGGAPSYTAYTYWTVGSERPFRFEHCLFESTAQFKHNNSGMYDSSPSTGTLEFIRCKWIRSITRSNPPDRWSNFETYAEYGMTGRLIECDFDAYVYLKHPHDFEIIDCVFREGILVEAGYYEGGRWKKFLRNFIRLTKGGFTLHYGLDMTDNIIFYDSPDHWNPHFMGIEGESGPVNIIGNIWYSNSTADAFEGDGIMPLEPETGKRADNIITIERNIFLPNGRGPDGENSFSCTGFTILFETYRNLYHFKNNTLYTGNGIGGLNIGETNIATTGNIGQVTSNLFIGDIHSNGMKMNNMEAAQEDVFLAQNADYNGSWRIRNGTQHGPGSGKGYGDFTFSGSNVVGEHDIDDEDPDFIDPTRTPTSWAGNVTATMDRLSPGGGYTMEDLLHYIREGFKPRNTVYQNAGHPDDGSPDIGAVPLNYPTELSSNFDSSSSTPVQSSSSSPLSSEEPLSSALQSSSEHIHLSSSIESSDSQSSIYVSSNDASLSSSSPIQQSSDTSISSNDNRSSESESSSSFDEVPASSKEQNITSINSVRHSNACSKEFCIVSLYTLSGTYIKTIRILHQSEIPKTDISADHGIRIYIPHW